MCEGDKRRPSCGLFTPVLIILARERSVGRKAISMAYDLVPDMALYFRIAGAPIRFPELLWSIPLDLLPLPYASMARGYK